MKKLPIGIQTFSEIRESNYIYIDKTEMIIKLIENGKNYFLSRPRRFGKSLFLDTLKCVFEGKKELFKDLYIYNKWNFERKHPVIKIDFSKGVVKSVDELKSKISFILKENQEYLNINCSEYNYSNETLSCLIKKAFEKYKEKVVILIDEYDKPILDNILNKEISKEIRDELRNIYSVIKGSDEYIKFSFITGVSKFSKISLFSGLNNIYDITITEKYSTICGYTQNDLEREFYEYLTPEVDKEKIKRWYNGYSWLGESVYNPFDILLFFSNNNIFKNYWFETGNPTFLIDMIKEKKYYLPDFENIVVNESILNKFDVDEMSIEALFWQTGYLTIKNVIYKGVMPFYVLNFPNIEVKTSLTDYLLYYLVDENIYKTQNQMDLYDLFTESNLNGLEKKIYSLFASIPHNNYSNNKIFQYEGFYASVIYAYLASLGFDLIPEDVTNKGRIDLTLITTNKIVYIIEFKVVDKKSRINSALKQIKQKKYFEKYLSDYKDIYLIGIEFNQTDKNVSNVKWEKYE